MIKKLLFLMFHVAILAASSAEAALVGVTYSISLNKSEFNPGDDIIATIVVTNSNNYTVTTVGGSVVLKDPIGQVVQSADVPAGIAIAPNSTLGPYSQKAWTVPKDAIQGVYTVEATVDTDCGSVSLTHTFKVVAASAITLRLSSNMVEVKHELIITGSVNPPIANQEILLRYSYNQSGWVDLARVYTDSSGNYTYVWKPTLVGVFQIIAQFEGNASLGRAATEVAIIAVIKPVSQVPLYIWGILMAETASLIVAFITVVGRRGKPSPPVPITKVRLRALNIAIGLLDLCLGTIGLATALWYLPIFLDMLGFAESLGMASLATQAKTIYLLTTAAFTQLLITGVILLLKGREEGSLKGGKASPRVVLQPLP